MSKRKNNLTPQYVLEAVAKYDRKVTKKSVVLNPEVDGELLDAVKKDDGIKFSRLCKHLLRKHYGLE